MVQADFTANKLIELHRVLFETIGYQAQDINTDLDCFRLKVVPFNHLIDLRRNTRVEPLLLASLEMFSRFLSPSYDFQRSNSYFLNLHPKPLFSNFFTIEIDYLSTSDDIIYLEAYCYAAAGRLVGKGGYMMVKE